MTIAMLVMLIAVLGFGCGVGFVGFMLGGRQLPPASAPPEDRRLAQQVELLRGRVAARQGSSGLHGAATFGAWQCRVRSRRRGGHAGLTAALRGDSAGDPTSTLLTALALHAIRPSNVSAILLRVQDAVRKRSARASCYTRLQQSLVRPPSPELRASQNGRIAYRRGAIDSSSVSARVCAEASTRACVLAWNVAK